MKQREEAAEPKAGRPEVIGKLLGPAFIEELKAADVVFGRDEQTGNIFLVFGRSALTDIVCSGEGRSLKTVNVSIRQETDELEALLAAVRSARGYFDYRASA